MTIFLFTLIILLIISHYFKIHFDYDDDYLYIWGGRNKRVLLWRLKILKS